MHISLLKSTSPVVALGAFSLLSLAGSGWGLVETRAAGLGLGLGEKSESP